MPEIYIRITISCCVANQKWVIKRLVASLLKDVAMVYSIYLITPRHTRVVQVNRGLLSLREPAYQEFYEICIMY